MSRGWRAVRQALLKCLIVTTHPHGHRSYTDWLVGLRLALTQTQILPPRPRHLGGLCNEGVEVDHIFCLRTTLSMSESISHLGRAGKGGAETITCSSRMAHPTCLHTSVDTLLFERQVLSFGSLKNLTLTQAMGYSPC